MKKTKLIKQNAKYMADWAEKSLINLLPDIWDNSYTKSDLSCIKERMRRIELLCLQLVITQSIICAGIIAIVYKYVFST